MKHRAASIPVRTYARNVAMVAVSFLASEASTAIQHQDEAVIGSISRTSDGVYVLTLNTTNHFKRIYLAGAPNVEKTGKWYANGHTIVEGSSTNAVTVEVMVDGVKDDPEAAVTLLLYCVLAGGS